MSPHCLQFSALHSKVGAVQEQHGAMLPDVRSVSWCPALLLSVSDLLSVLSLSHQMGFGSVQGCRLSIRLPVLGGMCVVCPSADG